MNIEPEIEDLKPVENPDGTAERKLYGIYAGAALSAVALLLGIGLSGVMGVDTLPVIGGVLSAVGSLGWAILKLIGWTFLYATCLYPLLMIWCGYFFAEDDWDPAILALGIFAGLVLALLASGAQMPISEDGRIPPPSVGGPIIFSNFALAFFSLIAGIFLNIAVRYAGKAGWFK